MLSRVQRENIFITRQYAAWSEEELDESNEQEWWSLSNTISEKIFTNQRSNNKKINLCSQFQYEVE